MDFEFRLITRQDFSLLSGWLQQPFVKKWWKDTEGTMAEVEAKYGGRVAGTDPTDVYLAMIDRKPIGCIQSYWIDDYPEHAESVQLGKAVGIDLFIGELEYVGKGYGPQMLVQFIEKIIRNNYPTAELVVSDPEVQNNASVRAFEKAGFNRGKVVTGEYGREQLMIYKL